MLGANPEGGSEPWGARTKYAYSIISLRFEPLPYTMMQNSAIINPEDEYQRNTFIDQEPHAEILSLSGFQMLYTEGEGLPVGASDPKGQQYQAEVGQVTVKSDVRLTWVGVPESWVMYTGTKKPTRILFRLGTLNEGDFLGYEDGTLCLMGVKFTRKPWPLYQPPLTSFDAAESPFVYDIEFLFSYFNPTKGFTGDPPMQITNNLGWNNFIYRGEVTNPPTVDGNAGYWFYASFTGDENDLSLFQYSNYKLLFDSADNGTASGL